MEGKAMTLAYEDLCDKRTKERRQKKAPHTAQENWQAQKNLMSNLGPINDWKQPGVISKRTFHWGSQALHVLCGVKKRKRKKTASR